MWIPSPIYERIPQFWLLLGLLFMSSGTYLGFEYELSFLYFGVGFVCVAWSFVVFVKRSRYRSDPVRKPMTIVKEESQETTTEQTQQAEDQPVQQPG